MSEVVDDNYGQAHAVCKSVIEEGGRVAEWQWWWWWWW